MVSCYAAQSTWVWWQSVSTTIYIFICTFFRIWYAKINNYIFNVRCRPKFQPSLQDHIASMSPSSSWSTNLIRELHNRLTSLCHFNLKCIFGGGAGNTKLREGSDTSNLCLDLSVGVDSCDDSIRFSIEWAFSGPIRLSRTKTELFTSFPCGRFWFVRNLESGYFLFRPNFETCCMISGHGTQTVTTPISLVMLFNSK